MAWPLAHPRLVGPLELVTAPTLDTVSIGELKAQCRVDDDTERDYMLQLIRRATEHCQNECSRSFLTSTWDLPLAGFWCGSLKIPRPPLQSVTSVKYYATDGTLTTLDSAYCEVRKPWKQPGHICLAPGYSWPATQAEKQWPVVIRFVAGFSSADSVPHDWRAAVLMLAAHWFEHREAVSEVSGGLLPTPMAVQSILDQAKWGSYA